MKRFLSLLLSLAVLLSLAGCGTRQNTGERTFVDSLGREVNVPDKIDRVAVTGLTAQLALFALCPEKLVGVTEAIPLPGYENLPVLGQLYGGKGELNLETLLQSGAQVIVDIGDAKGSIADDLDALQLQTGIPVVHIDAALPIYGETFRTLGMLLDMAEQAELLAAYCERVYDRTCDLAKNTEKVTALYITGDAGQNVIAKDSYPSQIMDLLTNNLAVVDVPSSKGTGNEVSMEQILLWDPDYIIFAPHSIYGTVADDPVWQTLTAIQNGNYFEVPSAPYNWMGFPPGVQQHLGMLWLGKTLYPDDADYDLSAEAAEYYQLFYHCSLSDSMLSPFAVDQ